MAWREWIRTVEVEPSLYGADFAHLGDEIQALMRGGTRVFHFDVGDGHFIEPITMGPIVLQSLAPLVHEAGGIFDCHLMIEQPQKQFAAFAKAGADSVTVHLEVVGDRLGEVVQVAREHGLQIGLAFNPESRPAAAATAALAAGVDLVTCMSIHPGYSGQQFMPEALDRIAELRDLLPPELPIQVDGGVNEENIRPLFAAGARLFVAASSIFGREDTVRAYRRLLDELRVMDAHLGRALELARGGLGETRPNPTVGAVVVRGGEVVGEGWTEPAGGRHGEVVALDAAGERARGATLYVTMEPCAHHGRTPPCVDRVLEAGVARVVAASLDPNPEATGGLERLRAAGVETELRDSFEARQLNEAWRTWIARGRSFVVYKVAATLDGRVSVPGERWVSGEAARRRVHELRAKLDAVAVGMGTVRADAPRLDARDVDAARQPRRLVFGRGPLPPGSELELRTGPLEEELRALAADGVQSLLLEGGPTLATAFLEAELVDKLLVFAAPTLSGAGQALLGDLAGPRPLLHLAAEPVEEDLLLTAYLHEP